nr:GNAT family N-acetyltransferase [Nostoc sp. WHI]
MAGYEGHRGWINYLAVAPQYQRQGIGKLMMLEAEQLLVEVGCPKINLQVRTTNSEVIKFYQHLGYVQDLRTVQNDYHVYQRKSVVSDHSLLALDH